MCMKTSAFKSRRIRTYEKRGGSLPDSELAWSAFHTYAIRSKFGHALLTSQSFSRWHADGVACRQQAGKKRAKSEQRSGYEEAPRAKFALHPVREDGAEKAVNRNTHDDRSEERRVGKE